MTSFVIEGNHRIEGSVKPIGNKNAALPLLSACLLTDAPITLHNIPDIGDVRILLELLAGMGVAVTRRSNSITLCAAEVDTTTPDSQLFSQIRGSLTTMGPLLSRFQHFGVLASAGGDDIGRRRIDTHLQVFEALGAKLYHNGKFELRAEKRLQGQDILLDEASVTATENGIMAAALANGTTSLRNAASEPHVQDVCRLLVAMG